MSPSALTIEICSGPNDGESARSDTGSLSIGSRGAADLPLAGEPGIPDMVTFTLTGTEGAYSISADGDFTHAGTSTRSLADIALPVMVSLGGVDLCVSAVEGAGTLPPPAGTPAEGESNAQHTDTPEPPASDGRPKPLFGPDIPPPPPPTPTPPAAPPGGGSPDTPPAAPPAPPAEVGPLCPDCGLVNAPGATRCDRCRRWLD